jgi:hypothetical protein
MHPVTDIKPTADQLAQAFNTDVDEENSHERVVSLAGMLMEPG